MASKVAVVSGVSQGLGAALAATLVARGFEVVGLGRGAAEPLARSPGFRLVRADLADLASLPAIVETMFTDLATRAPESIVVINNAAVAGPTGVVGALDPNALAASIAVNLVAPVIVANAFVCAFRDIDAPRRLINVSSGAAVRPIPGGGAYSVAKAGLEMLTATIDAEALGIVAITIRPGIIDTGMQVFMRSQAPDALPSLGMFRQFHESGQLVKPEVTAAKIVDRLVVGPVEHGRAYNYAEL